jgi:hypothetical protein
MYLFFFSTGQRFALSGSPLSRRPDAAGEYRLAKRQALGGGDEEELHVPPGTLDGQDHPLLHAPRIFYQVLILPKVTNIRLQIFVITCRFYIFVTFNQSSLVGQFFAIIFKMGINKIHPVSAFQVDGDLPCQDVCP